MHPTRIYHEGIYFITTVIQDRIKFFNEPLFCELFIDNLKMCKKLKKFKLFAFVVLLDHVHLLIAPTEKFNISEIMHSLKKSFSRDFNNFHIFANEGEVHEPRLRELTKRCIQNQQYSFRKNKLFNIPNYNKYLKNIYKFKNLPKFQWQKSFHDHIIRGDDDLDYHMWYILNNSVKHNIGPGEKYKYSSYKNYHNLIDEIEI